jgi:hypothetical protein
MSRHAITRRSLLQCGAAGMGALGAFWGKWLQAANLPTVKDGRAKSVILIFNCGAPSHIDLWDPKPNAPDTVRGLFHPIATSVPGVHVSELLPQAAARMDKLAVVRSMHHRHSSHNAGMYWSIVGQPYRVDSTLINPSRTDLPSLGTLVGWLAQRHGYDRPFPPYVITPGPHCDSLVYLTPGQFGACLGVKYDPFVVNSDPNSSSFNVPNLGRMEELTNDRLQSRQSLWREFDNRGRRIETPSAGEWGQNHDRAISLITAGDAGRAFDLSQEPDEVRDRYGRHTWGQSHLLARRLVEAGVPFVTTVNGQSIVWDTHEDNFNRLKERLVPPMERAFVALLDDLEDRGLLDTTLVVWMGDFGRTPIINSKAGRDHWPQCYSVVLAGGGIRGGQVVGESDATGATPRERPVTPADIHATIFTALGYDPRAINFHTSDGRPMPLSTGNPIHELL